MDSFIIVNGVLTRKLFVGPIFQVIKEKHKIADRDDRIENVNEVEAQAKHLKEQQVIASTTIAKTETIGTTASSKNDGKIIRRRRKFTYSNVDEILSKGYWATERRSYTKYSSNSLMFEYTQIRGKFKV